MEKSEEQILLERLKQIRVEADAKTIEDFIAKYGFKVGDEIEWWADRDTAKKTGVITYVQAWHETKEAQYLARPYNKDGFMTSHDEAIRYPAEIVAKKPNEKEPIQPLKNSKWQLSRESEYINVYVSENWLCSDNDHAQLEIMKDGGSFCLNCFSGTLWSHIVIDNVTIWRFHKEAGFDDTASFEEAAFKTADYLCSKFCQWSESQNQ